MPKVLKFQHFYVLTSPYDGAIVKEKKRSIRKRKMKKLFENTYRSRFSLTNDLVFYLVYGAGTEASNLALVAMLNVVLDRKEDPITKIKVINTVHKGLRLGDKTTVMDIKAETDSGEMIDVEMQKGTLHFYSERSLFYGARMVNSSLESGINYDKMKKSIVISFVDGTLFPDTRDLHTEFLLQEKNTHFVLTDRLSLHFIELGKVDDKVPLEKMLPLERFCAYLKYAGDETRENYVNKLLDLGEEAVDMSEYVFREITEDDLAREMLERQEKAAHDIATWKELARREGLEEGREEGKKEGREEGKKEGREEGRKKGIQEGRQEGYHDGIAEVAKKMKSAGMSVEEIVELTGLQAIEIEKL